jgi:hypothetical protein
MAYGADFLACKNSRVEAAGCELLILRSSPLSMGSKERRMQVEQGDTLLISYYSYQGSKPS